MIQDPDALAHMVLNTLQADAQNPASMQPIAGSMFTQQIPGLPPV